MFKKDDRVKIKPVGGDPPGYLTGLIGTIVRVGTSGTYGVLLDGREEVMAFLEVEFELET